LVQISIFYDSDHVQSSSFYVKRRWVKTEGGVRRIEGGRERDKQIKREGDGA
jgi:hypothetical protein